MSVISSNDKLKQAAAGAAGGELLAIEDVFSTYLYTGNGSTLTITNEIDLAGEGGLVWIKDRTSSQENVLYDTERGAGNRLVSNATFLQSYDATTLTSFNSNGFSLGSKNYVNVNANNFTSWTFRKAPRFFDVVTYTGDGVAGREIAHNLGMTVGTLIVKRLDGGSSWQTYHRGLTAGNRLELNTSIAQTTVATTAVFGDDSSFISPTDSVFTVGSNNEVNGSGSTYVAYLFAHDPLGPSGDGSDGLIACGGYTNDSSGKATIDLGWEPQWILAKRTNFTGSWFIFDTMRGLVTGGADLRLIPNGSDAESSFENYEVTSTGFKDVGPNANANFIYIAIRRGPMRQPTSGTEVYNAGTVQNNTGRTILPALGYPVDWVWDKNPGTASWNQFSRLTGGFGLASDLTRAEINFSVSPFDNNTTVKGDGWAALGNYSWMFRRAPGFFDVVAYTGDGVSGVQRPIKHNLTVAPDIVILKRRDSTAGWPVSIGTNIVSENFGFYLDSNTGLETGWTKLSNNFTSTTFTVNGSFAAANALGGTYVAYLFATLPGVSKVGSYTGNGTSQTINCGFTSGARFVLIKRTDSTGDWYVWDTARGIVAANDPHLSLNTTAAEVTTDDSIDPNSSGFIVNQVAATNINVSSASYIYLAIA